MALEPWYETQLVPPARAQEDPTESSDDVDGCEVRLTYKALHMLPHVGASYVLSLFEGKSGDGGLIVRAFDRAKRDTFWLSLSRNKVDAFGSNATRSPSALAAALTRRLKMKLDVAAGTQRLVLAPVKKIEPCSDKKRKSPASTSASVSVSADSDGTEADPKGVENAEAKPEPPPPSSSEDPVELASPQGSAQRSPQPRRSHPPAMRGSKVDDLGPLVEAEWDGSECSAKDGADTRSVPSVVDADGADAADEQAGNQSEVETVEVGKGGLGGTETEASGSYADDFTVDDNNEAGLGLPGGAGVEESGSYADDFAADEDDNFYDDDADQLENREGVDQLARAGGETAATSDVVRGGGSTTGSVLSDADVCLDKMTVSEMVVSGPGGTEPDGGPSEDVHARVESKAEDDYGKELSEEDDEQDQSPKTNVVAPSNETAASLEEPEEPPSSSTDVPAAGDGGALESQTPRSENYDEEVGDVEGTNATGVGAEPAQYAQESDDNPRESPGETVRNSSVPKQTTAVDEPGEGGAAERELLAEEGDAQEVQSHDGSNVEAGDDQAQQQPLPKPTSHCTQDSPVDLAPTSISIDSLGNMKVSAGEGYASEFEDAPEEAIQDDLETSMTSEVAAAVVAAAESSALELVSERSGSDAPRLVADSAASTKEAEATQNYPEDDITGTGVVVSMVAAETPASTEQRQSSGESELPTTSRTSLIEFEERFADTADDNDTEEMSVRSGDTHQVAAAQAAAEADAAAEEAEAACAPVSAPEFNDHANENDRFLTDGSVQDVAEEIGVQEDPPLEASAEGLVPQTSPPSREEEPGVDNDAVPTIAIVGDAAEEDDFEMEFEQEEAEPAQPPTGDAARTEETRSVPGDTPFPVEPEATPSLEGNPAEEVDDDENEGTADAPKEEHQLSAAPKELPSPSLNEQEPGDEALSGGQAEGAEETKETCSMTEGEDFEEDFEDDFASAESDAEDRGGGFDEHQARQKTNTPEVGSREETLVVVSTQKDGGGGAEAFSESEDLNIPECTGTAGPEDGSVTGSEERKPRGESSQREATESRQSVEEVRGANTLS